MKIADVKIGETYLTKVSGAPVRVVVVQRVEPTVFSKMARFRVRRVDNGRVLDKSRAASALRPLPVQDPVVAALIAGAKAARQLDAEGRWANAALAWEALAMDAAAAKRPKFAARAANYAAAARARLEVAPVEPETAK